MNKVIDVNVEDYKISEKIIINIKNFNPTNYSKIKCFKNFDDVTTLEAKKLNIIKIQKTIFLNLSNLQLLDLRDNKLLKISKNLQILKNLKYLKLDDNSITFLPSFIGNLEKLEILTITSNNLKFLPTSIQYLQKLKTLKLSNNQITTLPIEFGLLTSLECLYIDANHFTEIPTTICYMKHLSELCFEWLEFIDPPFQKLIKENIGKTIITLIRNSLQEMIKHNFLYCDLMTFIKKNSNTNSRRESNSKIESFCHSIEEGNKIADYTTVAIVNNLENIFLLGDEKVNVNETNNLQNQKKLMKIFYAIENNYFGVIKGLITSNYDYLKIRNGDNKTPLYLSIHNNKIEITNLILTKINFTLIPNSHVYLHKAIRMRDPLLCQKLIEMGIDINAPDDQGATCLHVLFSSFTKNYYKCSLIGDILLRYSPRLNALNNDSWAPSHIAARRSVRECLIWIIYQNKILRSNGKEIFDLNIKGKNKWTPLHLAVNVFRLEETMILLENGCDVFAKNSDGKIPRRVANGNYLLTKLLRNYEQNILSQKYPNIDKSSVSVYNQNCFTTVEDTSNIEDRSSFLRQLHFYDKKENIKSFSPVFSEGISNSNSKVNSPNREKRSSIKNLSEINLNNFNIIKSPQRNSLKNTRLLFDSDNKDKNFSRQSNESISNMKESFKINIIDNTSKLLKFQGLPNIKDSNQNYKKTSSKINLIPAPGKPNLKPKTSQMKSSSLFQASNSIIQNTHPLKKSVKINLHFHKEIILSADNSLAEKYESLMHLKILSGGSQQNMEVENIIKSILESIDLELEINKIIFCDICNLVIVNQYFNMISLLEMIHRTLGKKKKTSLLIQKELVNTISILKAIQTSVMKTIFFNQEAQFSSITSNSPSLKRRERKQSANKFGSGEVKTKIKIVEKTSKKDVKKINSIPKIKNITKYMATDSKRNVTITPEKLDEYDHKEMNEISQSFIDLQSYNQQIPKRKLKEVGERYTGNTSNNYTGNDESCNVVDSSWSMVRYENDNNGEDYLITHFSNQNLKTKNDDVKLETLRPDEDAFSIAPPKNISSNFFEI